nr:ATP-binding protein [Bacillus weihaiensis]
MFNLGENFHDKRSSFLERESERRRLTELYQLDLVETPEEESFDRITNLASRLFQAPIALFTLITDDKQWFKSCVGLTGELENVRSTDRSVAFCHHVVVERQPIVIEDTLLDDRFKHNRLVEEYGFRFYAGAPVMTKKGNVLGSLCLLDYEPRTFTSRDRQILIDLSQWIVTEIELRTDLVTRTNNERSIKTLYEVTSNKNLSFNEKLNLLLVVGSDRFQLTDGMVSEIELEQCKVIAAKNETGIVKNFSEVYRVEEYYTRQIVESLKPVHFRTSYSQSCEYEHLSEYLAAPIFLNETLYGSICFCTKGSIKRRISDSDIEFLQLIAQWIGNEIERIQAETSLQESQERFQQIANNINEAFWIYDFNEKKLVYKSPVWYEIVGKIGRECRNLDEWYQVIHPDDRDWVIETLRNLKTRAEFDYRLLYKNGQVHWIRNRIVPILNEKGEKFRFVGVAEDITEYKLNADLFRKSDKLAAVGQLAASIAHEVRNPLTSIKGFMQLGSYDTFNNPYHDLIISELNQIEEFVNEILILANSHIETVRERKKVIDLIEQSMYLVSDICEMQNISFLIHHREKDRSLWCNENQLKQVFHHIFTNAIEAMPNGGTIEIELGQENKEFFYVTIQDQGIGIEKERLARLGEPFYSNKEKGSGLGLMICYRIIENHKGQIHFTSELNKGTRVKLLLPLLD